MEATGNLSPLFESVKCDIDPMGSNLSPYGFAAPGVRRSTALREMSNRAAGKGRGGSIIIDPRGQQRLTTPLSDAHP